MENPFVHPHKLTEYTTPHLYNPQVYNNLNINPHLYNPHIYNKYFLLGLATLARNLSVGPFDDSLELSYTTTSRGAFGKKVFC